jgi:hypothetical protein
MTISMDDLKFVRIYFTNSGEERVTTWCHNDFIKKIKERAIVG